tara:strand:+ start:599 stop:2851 length:2253 start_codon:yes stop_codon:yes gene_type:complete
MAEKKFDEALELINKSDTYDNKLSSQAVKLIEESIKNALVVENKFYNSKYIDDAYYLLGRGSYLLGRITASSFYFKEVLNRFPESEYFLDCSIWYAYIKHKVGFYDEAKDISFSLLNDNLDNTQKYLLYYLIANIYHEESNFIERDKYFELAINSTEKSTQKNKIYYFLLTLAEGEGNMILASKYINEIEKNSINNNLSQELLEKWFKYNRIAGNYADVLDKIEDLLNKSNYNQVVSYKVEKARTYLQMEDFLKSKDLLEEIIFDYSGNSTYKNQLCEAHNILGEIYLKKLVDFEYADSNFNISSDLLPSSEFGKKSKKYLEYIDNFYAIEEEILYQQSAPSTDELEENSNQFMVPIQNKNQNILDSLAYSAAQIMYFDLDISDSAIVRLKDIVKNYPNSNYAFKALHVLDIAEPSNGWKEIIIKDYNDSLFKLNNEDSLTVKRDAAWDLLSVSYDRAMSELISISNQYSDSQSLYAAGYISDYIYNDIENSVTYYNEYLSKYPDSDKNKMIESRLNEIQGMIDYEIQYLKQKINYRKSLNWIRNDLKVDSALVYLKLSSEGVELPLRSYSESLILSIENYKNNKELYDSFLNDSLKSNKSIDSVKLNIANFYFQELDFDNKAQKLYKEIIESNSNLNYVNTSLASMSMIEVDAKWDSVLFEQINDSALFKIIINNSLKKDSYKLTGSMNSDSLDNLYYNNLFENLFKIEDLKVDSLDSKVDSLELKEKFNLRRDKLPENDILDKGDLEN